MAECLSCDLVVAVCLAPSRQTRHLLHHTLTAAPLSQDDPVSIAVIITDPFTHFDRTLTCDRQTDTGPKLIPALA